MEWGTPQDNPLKSASWGETGSRMGDREEVWWASLINLGPGVGAVVHRANFPLVNCPEVGSNQNPVSGWNKQWEKQVDLNSTIKGWSVLATIGAIPSALYQVRMPISQLLLGLVLMSHNCPLFHNGRCLTLADKTSLPPQGRGQSETNEKWTSWHFCVKVDQL